MGGGKHFFFVNASSDLRIAGEGLVSGLDTLTQGRSKPGSRSQLSHIRSLCGVGEFVQPCAVLCCVLLSPVSLGEAIIGTMVTKIEQMM